MLILLALLSALTQTQLAHADQYSTSVENIQCKPLDYDSYHRAQTSKSNLIRNTPDMSRPNFAGKYLLLRNDFIFRTSWLLADCASGKFVKEMLSTSHSSPKAEFKAESSLLVIKDGKDEKVPPEFHTFQKDGTWKQVDQPSSPVAGTPSPAAAGTTAQATAPITAVATATNEIFAEYPATPLSPETTCKDLDFNSYFRAQSRKKSLIDGNPERSRPNFGGRYLLLKGETIAGSYWLIADCLTGKFYPEILNGDGHFEKNSRMIKIFSSGSFPSYYAWIESDHQWIQVRDPNQKENPPVKNSLHGKSALILYEGIPNPLRSDIVRFENLKCYADHCEADVGKEKGKRLQPEGFQNFLALVQTWGVDLAIKTGNCRKKSEAIHCDIEN